jgi:hypothetical protein
VAADDEFESFRGSIADLDHDREQRIRSKFEGLRGPIQADTNGPPEDGDVTHLRLVAASGDPRSTPRHSRPVLVGVAAAVVLMVLTGTIGLLRSSDDGAEVASSVEDVPLSEVAARAGSRADVTLPSDGLLHGTQVRGLRTPEGRDRAETLTIDTSEEWARRDGTGLLRSSSDVVALGPGTPLGSSANATDTEVVTSGPIQRTLSYDELRALPTDPDELLAFVRARVSGDDSSGTAELLAKILAIDVVAPATRAAGFRALEQIGAVPIGTLTDYSGQTYNAYSGTDPDGRPWVVLVDPLSTRVTGFAALGGTGDAMFRDADRWIEFGPQEIVSELPD